MTMHIDLRNMRDLDAFSEALLSSIKKQPVVSLQRVADLTGTISRLSFGQCICRKCGLSCTGWFDKEANGYECENECEYDTGGHLMNAMKQRYNAEMAGVI
jgi:hypothetical protein